MPCNRIENAIICSNYFRNFIYKKRQYRVEEGGWGRAIWDVAKDAECIWWEFTGRKLAVFEKEINRGIN